MNSFPSRKTLKEAIKKLSALRVPGGNQVDGLPPASSAKTVAKRASRGGCTTVLLTMMKVLGNYNNSCGAHIEVNRNGIIV